MKFLINCDEAFRSAILSVCQVYNLSSQANQRLQRLTASTDFDSLKTVLDFFKLCVNGSYSATVNNFFFLQILLAKFELQTVNNGI